MARRAYAVVRRFHIIESTGIIPVEQEFYVEEQVSQEIVLVTQAILNDAVSKRLICRHSPFTIFVLEKIDDAFDLIEEHLPSNSCMGIHARTIPRGPSFESGDSVPLWIALLRAGLTNG